ncbi:MAG: imidazole glycerol phosphate synthase subunit HisH [Gammaproteobacteria bacterium]
MIGLVDYGLGNIRAFENIYRRLAIPVAVIGKAQELESVERLILPGVGAFDWAMRRLNESGMRDALDHAVLEDHRPVLGVCVGMQMMANRSDEGDLAGLGWIDGEVRNLDRVPAVNGMQLPHMGWNDVSPVEGSALFNGLGTGARFYFLHSYYFAPTDDSSVLCGTRYGDSFASGVRSGNAWGVQFHPEKSHQWGIKLLKNFAEL